MSSLYLTSNYYGYPESEGTLITQEQVEEITNRISKSVSEQISEQLEKAFSLVAQGTEEHKQDK